MISQCSKSEEKLLPFSLELRQPEISSVFYQRLGNRVYQYFPVGDAKRVGDESRVCCHFRSR